MILFRNQGESPGGRQAPCVLWTGKLDDDGYPAGRKHRAVLSAKLGRPLARGEHTRHTCDNRACVNPEHLEPGSALDNVADREARDRTARGEDIPWSKLRADQVRSIMAHTQVGMSRASLGRAFGISPRLVTDIVTGRRWNSVTGLPRARKPIPYSQRGEIRRAA